MDKLFIVKSPWSLRCSLNIFPMLCPIRIGPLFHQEFHKGWTRLILLAHGHGPMKSIRPHFLFLSSSATPFTPFDPSLLCKGSIGVTKFEIKWRLRILSGRWLNQYSDGLNFTADGDESLWRVVYGAWSRQVHRSLTSCRGIKGNDMCHSSSGSYLGSKCRFIFRALHL